MLQFGDARVPRRIWKKISVEATGDWMWRGGKTRDGYGYVSINGKVSKSLHRYFYEVGKGPILSGLEIDHLCSRRACCNPEHLEAVTHAQNMARGLGGAVNAAKTHCLRGHEFDSVSRRGQRLCSICRKMSADLRRKRMFAERGEDLQRYNEAQRKSALRRYRKIKAQGGEAYAEMRRKNAIAVRKCLEKKAAIGTLEEYKERMRASVRRHYLRRKQERQSA